MTISKLPDVNNSVTMTQVRSQGLQAHAGGVNGQRPPPPPPPISSNGLQGETKGGNLPAAVTQTLSKLGILTTESESSDSETLESEQLSTPSNEQTRVEAIGNFMLDLMGALHAQAKGETTTMSAASTTGAQDPQVLENSFKALLTAFGVAENQVSLRDFLNTLSETGLGAVGNVIDTLA